MKTQNSIRVPNTKVYQRGNLLDYTPYLYYLVSKNKVIYIGRTSSIENRIKMHKTDKVFDTVLIRKYDDQWDLHNAELVEIAKYNPPLNVNTGGKRRGDLIQMQKVKTAIYIDRETIEKFGNIHSCLEVCYTALGIKSKTA